MKLIKYKKTVVGWYNFEFNIFEYNIEPEVFRQITGVSEQASMGVCELSIDKVEELKSNAKYMKLADGWEIVPNMEVI